MKRKLWRPRTLGVLSLLAVIVVVVYSLGAINGRERSGNPARLIGGTGSNTNTTGATGNQADAPAAQVENPAGNAPGQITSGGAGGSTKSTTRQEVDRLVVQTANLSVKVDDVNASLEKAQGVAFGLGGTVLSSNTRQEGEYLISDLTITVPSDRFGQALNELRGLAKEVVSETAKGEDVTEEYVDLQSRQRNLEATEKSLLTLISRSKTVGEVLSVQRELSKVQGELEQVKGRSKYLSTRAAESQITLNLRPLVVPEPAVKPAPAWSPARVVESAWNASLRVLQGIATVAISVVVFGWWLVPLALMTLIVWRRVARPRLATRATQRSTEA